MANQQNHTMREQLEEYKARFRKSRRLKRISIIAAVCLATVVVMALVIPALTFEKSEPLCGLEEHVHSDQCETTRVLTCDFPTETVHVHSPACYDELGNLICPKDAEGHMHLSWCYNDDGNLVCTEEETVHIHNDSCLDDNGIAMCDTKADHVHGDTCYTVHDGEWVVVCHEPSVGHVHNLSCLDEAGNVICDQIEDLEVNHVHGEDCYQEVLACEIPEHTHTDLCYDQITQELIKNDEKKQAENAAAEDAESDVADVEVEADFTDEEITEAKDQGLLFENDDVIVAFAVPEDIKDGIELKVTEIEDDTVIAESSENVSEAMVEDGNNAEVAIEEMNAEGISEEVAIDMEPDAIDADGDEQAYQVNLHIEATLDGKPVGDISKLGLSAKLQMKPKVIAPLLAEIDYDEVAPEIKDEIGAEITILQQPRNGLEATISEMQGEQVDQVVATNVQEAATSFAIVSSTFTASVNNTPNAEFTVKYLAPVVVPELSDSGTLPVIDTSKDGDGTGSNMPQNGVTLDTQYLQLNSNGQVETSDDEVPIYSEETFWYYKSPTLDHFNKVYKNVNYELETIRVREGNDVVLERAYDEKTTFFTNRSESAGEHEIERDGEKVNAFFILIEDGITIELVFDLTPGSETIEGSFYDYDITDGYIYNTRAGAAQQNPNNQRVTSLQDLDNWAYYRHANTLRKGINSDVNYSDPGVKLGFGNVNTGTGLGNLQWESNQLNMYNWSGGSYEGCTFGLVESLKDGLIQYVDGVSAPNLFNEEGGAVGKAAYDNMPLTFSRVGDTYTLSSVKVEDQTTSGLGKFSHPGNYNHIWTNNFWPVDNTSSYGTDGHDLRFGSTDKSIDLPAKRQYTGVEQECIVKDNDTGGLKTTTKNASGNFPPSDDGLDHNSYFGMHYTVNFELTEDYVGPLEYLFFGDDDLWIFLDDKLVVDIGGVHSSVGEYVNLWDHIKKGTSGKHTLSVFYTERGASGSTCYMNFTLPSVSSSTIEQDTGAVTILKNVSATKGSWALDREFNFSIKLTDAKGNRLVNDYSYTRFDKDGNEIASNLIIWDGGTFSLCNGEFVTINYLPVGATYTIQEVFGKDEDVPYFIDWEYFKNNESTLTDSGGKLGNLPKEFTGTVEDTTTKYRLEYTNTVPPELPETGGIGAHWFLLGGGALIVFALIFWKRQRAAAAAAQGSNAATVIRSANSLTPSGKPEYVEYGDHGHGSNTPERAQRGGGL